MLQWVALAVFVLVATIVGGAMYVSMAMQQKAQVESAEWGKKLLDDTQQCSLFGLTKIDQQYYYNGQPLTTNTAIRIGNCIYYYDGKNIYVVRPNPFIRDIKAVKSTGTEHTFTMPQPPKTTTFFTSTIPPTTTTTRTFTTTHPTITRTTTTDTTTTPSLPKTTTWPTITTKGTTTTTTRTTTYTTATRDGATIEKITGQPYKWGHMLEHTGVAGHVVAMLTIIAVIKAVAMLNNVLILSVMDWMLSMPPTTMHIITAIGVAGIATLTIDAVRKVRVK